MPRTDKEIYGFFDTNNKVFFYDHNLEVFNKENFIPLDIDFAKWLQYAYLNKQLDELYDDDKVSKEIEKEYEIKLAGISELLLNNYPFKI